MTTEHDWERLNKDYRKNGIALALGAGVSADCNLPNWCELLERIAFRCYGDVGEKFFQEMIKDGYPLPAIASILEADCPAGCDFGEVIRAALYQTFPYYETRLTKFNSGEFVDFVKAKNRTLSAVAALCAVKQSSGSSYAANQSIHAIVNSNFDATLREYARARYRAKTIYGILRTVERPSAGAIPGRIIITCTTCTDSSNSAKTSRRPTKRLPISEYSPSRSTSTFSISQSASLVTPSCTR